jgi:2-dehydro-3-deoxygluconokinase
METMATPHRPRIVTFGEIMLRLAPPGHQRLLQAIPGSLEATFAGAEANVAAGIASLGGNAAFVTSLPDSPLGDAALASLRATGVDTSHILRRADGRLGLYFYEKGASQRPGSVLYDRADSTAALTSADSYNWAEILQGAAWFHVSGITPAISEAASQAALAAVRTAAEFGVPVSFDMNFRAKLWHWHPGLTPRELAAKTVRQILPLVRCFIGGPDDIGLLLGRDRQSMAPEELAKALVREFPNLTQVAMTCRGLTEDGRHLYSGSLYHAENQKTVAQWLEAPHRGRGGGAIQPYVIFPMVDRLGVGDAFAAGLIFALTDDRMVADPQRALEFAVAHGCLCHSLVGDFSRFSRSEVEALLGENSGGILR